MPHTYKSTYPPYTKVDSGIVQFFEDFYKLSDTPDAHDEYVDQFTKDATLVMASKKGVGSEEILAIRKGLWAAISERLHSPTKVFPFGDGEGVDEVMLYGTVAFKFKDGRRNEIGWSARANLVQDEGRWKMKYYQVYLDTAAMQNAK